MNNEKPIREVKALRNNAVNNTPSASAIGAAFCRGKVEQAQRDAQHHEFMRGQVVSLERVLKLLHEVTDEDIRETRYEP